MKGNKRKCLGHKHIYVEYIRTEDDFMQCEKCGGFLKSFEEAEKVQCKKVKIPEWGVTILKCISSENETVVVL